jgi:hypothetical protein
VSLDRDRALTSELTHRAAAAHLCDRPERGPRRATIPSRALIAELAVRAADTHAPRSRSRARRSRSSSRDREISAPRAAGTGDVAPLVGRRQDLRDRAIALAMEQTKPADDSRPPVMRTYVHARLASG